MSHQLKNVQVTDGWGPRRGEALGRVNFPSTSPWESQFSQVKPYLKRSHLKREIYNYWSEVGLYAGNAGLDR